MTSLGDYVFKGVVKAVIVTALIVFGNMSLPHSHIDPERGGIANGMNSVLYAHRYECWTGPQPSYMDNATPTHAIIRYPDTPWIYTSKATQALDHVFSDKYPRMEVMAFCK